MFKKKELEVLGNYWDKENFVSGARPHYCDFATQMMFKTEIRDVRNKSVLDIGCGQGRMMDYFIQHGAIAKGIDISRKNLIYAKNRHLSVLEADARSLPFADNSFDIVFSIGVVEHFVNTELAIREHVRVCKNCGVVVIIVPNLVTPYFFMGVFWHILRGSIRHGLVSTAGKSYIKSKLKTMLLDGGCHEVEVNAYYGSAFLKFFTSKLNKQLSLRLEESLFSRKFGHLLFALGYKK